MGEEEDRRALARVMINGKVRVRPVGSTEGGKLCLVRDSNAKGVRLTIEDIAGLEDGVQTLEVLTASARPHGSGLELKVVWSERRDDGLQHIGCNYV